MTKSRNFRLRTGSVVLGLLLTAGLSLGVLSCKKDDSTPVDQDAVANVQLGNSASLGNFLTDSTGNTLYFFARDIEGSTTCTSATCAQLWPVYYKASIKVPKSLKAEDFATRTTTDGRPQTTYKGWPLYYYAPASNGVYTREPPGQTGGNGVGGIWHVLNPDYGIVLASKAVDDQTTHTSATKTYLADAQGRALYFFKKDTSNPTTLATNCTGGCAGIWPPVYRSAPLVPSSLHSSDFTTLSRDSKQQLLYKGRPLYYICR